MEDYTQRTNSVARKIATSDWLVFAVGAIIVVVALIRLVPFAWGSGASPLTDIASLLLVGLAGLAWPSVESLKTPFGEITRRLEKELQNFADIKKQEVEEAAQPPAAKSPLTGVRTKLKDPFADVNLPTKTDELDTQKGRFGGEFQQNGRKLTATVEKHNDSTYYTISMRVSSTSKSKRLTGSVKFFIHESFGQDEFIVPVNNGVAILRVLSVGSFTVGAICSDGTLLELDLADPKLVDQPDDVFATI